VRRVNPPTLTRFFSLDQRLEPIVEHIETSGVDHSIAFNKLGMYARCLAPKVSQQFSFTKTGIVSALDAGGVHEKANC